MAAEVITAPGSTDCIDSSIHSAAETIANIIGASRSHKLVRVA